MTEQPRWFYTMQIESDEGLIKRETAQREELERWITSIDERVAQANARIEENQAAVDAIDARDRVN